MSYLYDGIYIAYGREGGGGGGGGGTKQGIIFEATTFNFSIYYS